MKTNNKNGFSLLEIMIVIVIVSVLIAVIIPNMSNFKSRQTLKNTTEDVVSLLNKAKLDSNSYLDSSVYSVYFSTDRVVYFKGTAYSSSNPTNQEILFNSSVNIPSVGGVNLINSINSNVMTFPQLTENVKGYGTIIIRMTADPSRQNTITVNELGSISLN